MSKSPKNRPVKLVDSGAPAPSDPLVECSRDIQAVLAKHDCVILAEPYFIPAEAGGFRTGARVRIAKKPLQ